jgi:Uma2 family endonuclease
VSATLSSMDVDPPAPRDVPDHDQVVLLRNVSWEHYVALGEAREGSQPRMAYLDGELELVTTSERHEITKKVLARLLECYFEERGVSGNGAGNTTFRKKLKSAGLEPDECYFLARRVKGFPDLAIEVVHGNRQIRQLEIYRRLRVREVWFWIEGKIWIYVLEGTRYEPRTESAVLPGIDLDELERIIASTEDDEQTEAVRAYRRRLRRT